MVAEALRALSVALGRPGWRWYVFGAQAVVVHGVPRLTADVDVTIDPANAPRGDVLSAFATEEIEPRAVGFDGFFETSRLWPMVHAPSRTPIDVVIAGNGIDRDFLMRAVVVDLGGYDIPVLSAEDLIATKVVAGRLKDREDVIGVLETKGDRLDLERLRRTLEDLDATLEEPRATRRFERIYRAFQRKRN